MSLQFTLFILTKLGGIEMNQGRKESQYNYSAKACFFCYVGFCAAATVWAIVELIKLML